jgi:hypothetical protein
MPSPAWKQWEEEVQHRLGLSATVSSGNQFQDPGDAADKSDVPHRLVVECKYTDRRSFTLRADKLASWLTTGILRGKMAIYAIKFGNRPKDTACEYVVLSLDDFEELLEKARMYSAWLGRV